MARPKSELKRAFDLLQIVNDDLINYAIKIQKYDTDSSRNIREAVLDAKALIFESIEKLGEANSIKLKKEIF